MQNIKELLLTQLRDKNTTREQFRISTENLAQVLAQETLSHLKLSKIPVETPLATTTGLALQKNVVLIPILRSGITLLPAFLKYFPKAAVGVAGLKRDEKTAQAHWYYKNLPRINPDDYVIILDPMIATAGTGLEVLNLLKQLGIAEQHIFFASIICAPEGINLLKKAFPLVTHITGICDSHLNSTKFIIPGLGDFGDRFFGTEG